MKISAVGILGSLLPLLAMVPGGCSGLPTVTPTPSMTETPTNVDATDTPATPTQTATDTPATPTQTATATNTRIPTPTPTVDPTPTATASQTPTPLPCVVPTTNDAVCMTLGSVETLVDGVVISPNMTEEELLSLPQVERIAAEFTGVTSAWLNSATGADDTTGVLGSIADLTVLNPVGTNGGAVENTPDTITVSAPDLSTYGVDLDVSAYSGFGSGWSYVYGVQTGAAAVVTRMAHKGACDSTGVCTLDVGETQVTYTEGAAKLYLSYESSPVGECQVRFFYQSVLVHEETEVCAGVVYDFRAESEESDPLEGERIEPNPADDDLIPSAAEDWDVGESYGKIRYTFTGYDAYDFDLP